jgi:hypothetical protein
MAVKMSLLVVTCLLLAGEHSRRSKNDQFGQLLFTPPAMVTV